MKKLLTLLICLPLAAIAQQSEFSFGIGASNCIPGQYLTIIPKKSDFSIVPNAQASYMKAIGKSQQVGVTVGVTSYRALSHSIANVKDAPRSSYRYAQVAIPLRVEGRHNINFDKSRIQLGMNAGVVICAGEPGGSGPFSGAHPWAVPEARTMPVGFKNTMALTAGAMIGFDHAVSKKLRIGISPAVNIVSGRFTPRSSSEKADRTELLDLQLRLNCSYICTKKKAPKR